ncbi:MAG: uncharacterized membrane protein YidH (DUF202 family) [Oceanicoccus sp.]|jgi:uncharacterized membrane protein YidH (DUF202 family)
MRKDEKTKSSSLARGKRERSINRSNPSITTVRLSRERTFLSRERTLLSHKRTCLSQVRLSVGIAALGFGVIRLFEDSPHSEAMVTLGFGFLLLSAFIGFFSWLDFRKYVYHLEKIRQNRGKLDEVYFDEWTELVDKELPMD